MESSTSSGKPPMAVDHLEVVETNSSLTDVGQSGEYSQSLPTGAESATTPKGPSYRPPAHTRSESGNVSMSYVSSESSTTGSPSPFTPQTKAAQPPPKKTSPPMTTINNASPAPLPVRKDSDEVMNIPPVHPFFQYDSDGSNGSFVQKRRLSNGGSGHRRQHSQTRDRFPSFDSMASTGSVRYVSPNSAGPSPVRQSQTMPVNPQLLPYHERRKLLQQRQQERASLGQASFQSMDYSDVRGWDNGMPQQMPQNAMDPRMMTLDLRMMPPPGSLPMQARPEGQPYGGQPPMDPAAMAAYANFYGYMPMPPQQMPPQGYPGMPYGYPPGPYYQPPYPPQGQTPPNPQQQPQQPQQSQQSQQLPPYQQQQQQYQQFAPPMPPEIPPYGYGYPGYGPQPPEPKAPEPPPVPKLKSYTPTASIAARNNPFGTGGRQSQDKPPKGKSAPPISQRSPRPPATNKASVATPIQTCSSTDTSNDNTAPPPPPPPLAPTNTVPSSVAHGRQESVGSFSSGSFRGNVEEPGDRPPKPTKRHHRKNSSGSFLDMIRDKFATPEKVDLSDPLATKEEYNRRSKEFLKGANSTPKSKAPGDLTRPMHQRVGSQDRPPASRGTHKRLPSITNDDWGEDAGKEESAKETTSGGDVPASSEGAESSSDAPPTSSKLTGSEIQEDDYEDERTRLLPPTCISSNERDGSRRVASDEFRISRGPPDGLQYPGHAPEDSLARWDSRSREILEQSDRKYRSSRKNRKKKHKRKHKSSRRGLDVPSSDSSGDEEAANYDYRRWTKKRARMLEKERAKLIEQWKEEAKVQAEMHRKEMEANRCDRLFMRLLWGKLLSLETFFSNLPLTIGAVAMAVVTLGVVWFKFSEENLDTCEPVHFHSSQCSFPEFPGCFYCDTNVRMYQVALYFHYSCNVFAGLLALCLVIKVILATTLVLDEMSSPTTASPAGLLCMTTVCVFAGRGEIGQFMVSTAALVHFFLVIWFMYIALAYRIMPDPSWFPNTVGVGLSAVKTWLYYPFIGQCLMAISLLSNFFFFPISLIRVMMNIKISATVGWMQMSAPAISLYALTIMAQPSFPEEHPDVTAFQRVHRMIYLPCMHFMAALSILGFLASCHSLYGRWGEFYKREFSPAHAAFCFPVLSHANALQAYRGAIISFSDIHPHSWRMIILYSYWFGVLLSGTVATVWITARFLLCLPKWTNLDLSDEEEPPKPSETILQMRDLLTAGETMNQPFVSPAVLQANETGALVLASSGPDGARRYVRTRRLRALGFEPTMEWSEMQEERELLLEWVGKNPPKRRHRTLSVPGVDFSYGAGFGTGNSGVYGSMSASPQTLPRRRADTGSPRVHY
eukprot:Nitzschia sp. Nitz4//scaffold17_size182527//147575//151746//NITZ4_001877-RA/size182527-snap-gene-0.302-mRNA-1//-1//CDS//3329539409//6868//frame0